LRTILLWLARNQWLRQRLPRLAFMRRAVRRFMPGESMGDALAAAGPLQAAGIGTIYTRLGENLTEPAAAEVVANHYLALMDRIAELGIDGEISVKPTQLGLDLDADATFGHLAALATRAAEVRSFVWIDMEGSAYAEATIALYERVRGIHLNTGICLQAYLRRTAADVERLLPLDPAIRLVKGAYDEPAAIAFRHRRDVDANYLAVAAHLLRQTRSRPVRVGLGTHDVGLIERIAEHVAPSGVARDAFQVEMLYGIRARDQFRLARDGYRVQTLIAYGDYWYPWYMRRLAERPANVLFALRQLLP